MNKIYKTKYNEALGAWVAVPEIAKGKGKTGSTCNAVLDSTCIQQFTISGLAKAIIFALSVFGITAQAAVINSAAGGKGVTAEIVGCKGDATSSVTNCGGPRLPPTQHAAYYSGVTITGNVQDRGGNLPIAEKVNGKDTDIGGENAIAFGNKNIVKGGNGGIAIGYGNYVNKGLIASTAIGAGNSVMGSRSTAIGYSASTSGNETVAIGTKAQATAESALAFGQGAQASEAGAIALGSESIGSRGIPADVGYYFGATQPAANATWQATRAAVSVGNGTTVTRQIINVAAGKEYTDAVNVAQLKSLADLPITFAGNSGTTEQKLGSTLNIKGGATGTASNTNVKTVVTDGNVDIQLLDAPTFAGVVKANGFDASHQKIANVGTGLSGASGYAGINNLSGDQLNYAVNAGDLKTAVKAARAYFSVNSTGGSNEDSDGAEGADSIAIGKNARALKSESIVIGGSAIAKKEQSIVIGNAASAKKEQSVVIGAAAKSTKYDTVVIGTNAESKGTYSVAIGAAKIESKGNNSIVIGANSGFEGQYKAQTNSDGTIAMGNQALVGVQKDSLEFKLVTNDAAAGAQAIGRGATIIAEAGGTKDKEGNASGSIALGQSAVTLGKGAVAIGGAAVTTTGSDLPRGDAAYALGDNALALSSNAQVFSTEGIAIGNGARVGNGDLKLTTDGKNIPIGFTPEQGKGADKGIAIGADSKVYANYSTAIGSGNTINNKNTLVLANDVSTSQNNSVILGNRSADRAATAASSVIDGVNYGNFAGVGSAANGVVSVGAAGQERQLINVAAGEISENSTDAINGSQLYRVIKAAKSETNAVAYKGNDKATEDGRLIELRKEGDKGTKITNLAEGTVAANSQDAVNGGQLFNVDEKATAAQTAATAAQTAAEKPLIFTGDTTDNGDKVKVKRKLTETLAINGGADLTKLSDNNIGVEADAATGALNIKLAKELKGLDSVTAGNTVLNDAGVTITPTGGATPISLTKDGLNNGDKTITNVGSGLGNVNDVQGIKAITGDAAKNAINAGDLGTAIGAVDDKFTKEISNLNTGIDNVINTGFIVDGDNGSEQTVKLGKKAKFVGGAGIVTAAAADVDDGGQITIGLNQATQDKLGKADSALQNITPGNNITIGTKDSNGNQTIGLADTLTFGKVTLGNDGLNNGGKALTGVLTNFTPVTDNAISAPLPTGLTSTNAATVSDVLNAGWNLQGNGEAVDFVKPFETVNFIGGKSTAAVVTTDANSKTNSIKFDVKYDDTTIGLNAKNELTIKGNLGNPNAVAYKGDMGTEDGRVIELRKEGDKGTKITNLANGTEDTDAVNVAQLKDFKTKFVSINSQVGANFENNGATGIDAIAIGRDTQAQGTRATAIGSAAAAGGIGSVSMGNNAKSSADFSTSLGANSRATVESGIALGFQSVADRDVAQVLGYDADTGKASDNATWKANRAALSIGNGDKATRQITSVAAGSEDTDAVNVAQLRAVANSPLTFTGNINEDTDKNGTQQKLGSTLNIIGASEKVGGVSKNTDTAVTGSYSAKNLQTVITDNEIQVQIAENPEFASVKIGDTTNNTTLTSTANGLDVGDDKITNVGSGLGGKTTVDDIKNIDANTDAGKTAVNAGDLGTAIGAVDDKFTKEISNLNTGIDNVVNTGFKVAGDQSTEGTQKLGGKTLTFAGQNGLFAKVVPEADGNNKVQIGLDPTQTLKTNQVELGGQGDTPTDGSLKVKDANGADGVSIAATDGEGIIGLNGKNGANTSIKVIKDGSKKPLDDTGEGTRLTYTDGGITRNIASLDDGLIFTGDTMDNGGKVKVKRKLTETLAINGGADLTKLSDNNIGVVADAQNGLDIKLAKELTGLDSVTAGKGDKQVKLDGVAGTITAGEGNKQSTLGNNGLNVIDGNKQADYTADGVTIVNPADLANPISLTKDGLNNGGKTITNVDSGLGGKTTVDDIKNIDANTDAGKTAVNAGDLGTAIGAVDDKFTKEISNLNTGIDNVVNTGFKVAGDQSTEGTQKLGVDKTLTFAGENGLFAKVDPANTADGSNTIKIGLDPTKALKTNQVELGGQGDTPTDGSLKVKDANGADGVSIAATDGEGIIGLNGKNGANTSIKVIKDGSKKPLDDTGEGTRLTYTDGGITRNIASLDDGLVFTGDTTDNSGKVKVKRKLTETLAINGGADLTKLSDNNIGVEADAATGALNIKLAKELKGLDSVTAGKGDKQVKLDGAAGTITAGEGDKQSTLGNNGLNVTDGNKQAEYTAEGLAILDPDDPKNSVSLTKDGLNNGGKTITNVGSGLGTADTIDKIKAFTPDSDAGKTAVNTGDLGKAIGLVDDKINGIKDTGFNLKGDGPTKGTQKLGADKTLTFAGQNGLFAKVVPEADGNNKVQIGLDPTQTLKTNQVELGGQGDTPTDGSLKVKDANGADGVSIAATNGEGIIGLNGKNGANTSIKVIKDGSKKPLDDTGEGTRLTYTDDGITRNIASLDDGLIFTGDTMDNGGKVKVKRKLTETLAMNGGADLTKLSDNNIGVEADAATGALNIKLAQDLSGLNSVESKQIVVGAGTNQVELGNDGVKVGGNTYINNAGINANSNVIRNVADGVKDTDAVNVKQLNALSNSVTDVKTEVKDVATIVGGNKPNDAATDAQGNAIKDADGKPIDVKVALKTYNVSDQKGFVNNSVVSAIHHMNEEGIKFFHTNDDTRGSQIPEQDENNIDASAAGARSTAIGYKATIAATADDSIAIGSGSKVTDGAEKSIAIGQASTVSGLSSIAIGTGHVVNGSNSGTFGDPNIVNGNDSYVIGNNNIVNANKVMVLGNGVEVAQGHDGSVVLGDDSTIEHLHQGPLSWDGHAVAGRQDVGTEVVSVGKRGKERQIQNVAPGVVAPNSTDAINGSQLYGVANAIDQRASAGIAGSMASAGLPQAYLPGKSMVAAAAGSYRGKNAIAIGVSSISDNGKWILKGTANANSEDFGVTVGVGYQW